MLCVEQGCFVCATTNTEFCCGIHSICRDCCSRWVQSVSEDAGILRTHGSYDWIGCAGRKEGSNQWCDAPIKFETLKSLETFQSLLETAHRVWKSRLDELMDTLNLKCPSCSNVLDPEAEACTAMCCSYCSSHFCFACLEKFPNSEVAHQHVPAKHGCDSAFAPTSVVEASHKVLRVKSVLKLLHPVSRASNTSGDELLSAISDKLTILDMPSNIVDLQALAALIEENSLPLSTTNMKKEQDIDEETSANLVALRRRVVKFESGLSTTLQPLTEDHSKDLERTRRARILRMNHQRGNWTAVEQFIVALSREADEVGIDWSEGDITGRTLLCDVVMSSSTENQEEVAQKVRFLLNHSCCASTPTVNGFTPLHLALFASNQPLFELLADWMELEANDQAMNSPQVCLFDDMVIENTSRSILSVAAEKGEVEAVEYLVRKGANVMLQDFKGNAALHLAIMFAPPSKALSLVECLLFDEKKHLRWDLLELVGDVGCRPLHLAIFRDNLSLMKYLITCGADLEAPILQNLVERKPLAYACELDRIDAAVMLLENGANEATFQALPANWKRQYVSNWLEERNKQGTVAGSPRTRTSVDFGTASGLIGTQLYLKPVPVVGGGGVGRGRVGVVCGYVDTSGVILVRLEGTEMVEMTYIEVLSAHIAYFEEFGFSSSFKPLALSNDT